MPGSSREGGMPGSSREGGMPGSSREGGMPGSSHEGGAMHRQRHPVLQLCLYATNQTTHTTGIMTTLLTKPTLPNTTATVACDEVFRFFM